MKFNLKVVIAIALIAVVAFWAFTSLQTQSYAGTGLDFVIGRGPVTVTNLSDAPAPIQLAGTGARSFSVNSTTEGVTGTSVREGNGASATQLLDLTLPVGTTIFSLSNPTNVHFIGGPDTRFTATVEPTNASDVQTTLIVAAVVIVGALFFIARTTGHMWMLPSRRRQIASQAAKRAEVDAMHGQGEAIRAYGDNRTKSSS